jgi:serine/threonine-protein kinase
MWRGVHEQARSDVVPSPGDRLGPYRLEEELGRGGMGIVFRAVRDADGEVCALKVLRPAMARDPTSVRRFSHESRAAREVSHPHLVPILDAGELNGTYFIATTYIEGSTLLGRIRDRGPLPIRDVCRTTAEVASALDALHARGLIHRDVKPSNVLLDGRGVSFLTDFGLSKGRGYSALTTAGQVMGTLDYLAPELIRGGTATPASDIYALGCTVHEAVTGLPPFGARSAFEVGVAHLQEEPPDPAGARNDVNERMSWAILQGLAKDPEARPPTATMYSNLLMAAAGTGDGGLG